MRKIFTNKAKTINRCSIWNYIRMEWVSGMSSHDRSIHHTQAYTDIFNDLLFTRLHLEAIESTNIAIRSHTFVIHRINKISGKFEKLISEHENPSNSCKADHYFIQQNYLQFVARCVENRNRINKINGKFEKLISEKR